MYRRNSHQTSVEAYLEVLKDIIRTFSRVYLVLDALDECGSRTKLTDILATMAEWWIGTLHLLVTSRKEQDIERSLNRLVEKKCTISLQGQVVDKDIQLYIRERLRNDDTLQKWRKDRELQGEIEQALSNGARGM
jgi:selenophosphate synthetase-related protein